MSAEKDISIPRDMQIFICGETHSGSGIGHIWDGKPVKIENGESMTCSKCGVSAYEWSMRNLP